MKWAIGIAIAAVVLPLLGAVAAAGVILYYRQNLPTFETLQDYRPPQTTKIYGADGTLAGEIFEERRTVIPYGDIPQVMIQAITSAEDAKFFAHSGVDYVGMIRCAIVDLIPGHGLCGASTLTQQTVKTMLLTNKRKFSRKIKEIILARRLEKHLSKEQILYIYLNQIDFGHARYGIEEASQFYFGHGAKELNLGEAALLASIPKWPNEINPITNPTRTKERQTYVLQRMVANHFLAQAVADREIAKPLPVPPPRTPQFGATYIEEIRRQLAAKVGEDRVNNGGLRVDTMMNPKLQQAAEAAVKKGLRELDKRQGWRGALGTIDDATWLKLKAAVQERLANAPPRALKNWGENPVLDLRNVDTDSLEDDATQSESMRAAAWRPREVGAEVVARVASVTKTEALIDMGTSTETISLASVGWARKFNPTSMTAAPKTMADVMNPGDLVRVRIVRDIPCASDRCERGGPDGHMVRNLPCAEAKCEHHSEIALEQDPLVQGAFVAIDPATRGVSALVGGYDFNAGSDAFNRATQMKRQPGSSFKPFVYATAMEVGQERAQLLQSTPRDQIKSSCLLFQPRLTVNDSNEVIYDRWTGKPWTVHNFERDVYEGPMSMRHALATSKNTVAVKLLEQIGCAPTQALSAADEQQAGLARVRDTAQRAGVDSPIPNSMTAALGTGEVSPVELTNAYATLAANGKYAAPIFVSRVRASDGTVLFENKMTYEQPPPLTQNDPEMPILPPSRGLKPDVAFVTANMMHAVIEDPEGTGRMMIKLGRPISGKTGTASEHRDAWFVGFTPEIVAGGWVGFDNHDAMGGRETGAHAAGPIWLDFMTAAEDALPHSTIEMPSGVVAVDVDPRTGLLADPHSPYLEHEFFLAGTEPKVTSQPTEDRAQEFMQGGP